MIRLQTFPKLYIPPNWDGITNNTITSEWSLGMHTSAIFSLGWVHFEVVNPLENRLE